MEGFFYHSIFCLHDINVQRGLKKLRKMELSMYSSRNYTEEKESGWLQKTQQKHPERLFVCSAP